MNIQHNVKKHYLECTAKHAGGGENTAVSFLHKDRTSVLVFTNDTDGFYGFFFNFKKFSISTDLFSSGAAESKMELCSLICLKRGN